MTTPEARHQAGDAPEPGWYADRDGLVRWWDGAGWTGQVRDEEPAPDEAAAPRRTRLVVRTLVTLLVFVLVAAATVVVIGLIGGDGEPAQDPAEVVESNFAALRDGDCAAFVATFSRVDREVMGEAFCRQSDVFGDEQLGDLTVASVDVDGEVARVTGTFTDAGGEQSFAFDLVREGDAWRIVQ